MKNVVEETPYNFLHNSFGSTGKTGSVFSDFPNYCSLIPNNTQEQQNLPPKLHFLQYSIDITFHSIHSSTISLV